MEVAWYICERLPGGRFYFHHIDEPQTAFQQTFLYNVNFHFQDSLSIAGLSVKVFHMNIFYVTVSNFKNCTSSFHPLAEASIFKAPNLLSR